MFIAPVNWRFRSGDRLEFNVNPTGERLDRAVRRSSRRRRFRPARTTGAGTGSRWAPRRSGGCTRSSPGGSAASTTASSTRSIWTGAWNPTPLFTVEFSGERNIGDFRAAHFTQTLVGTRLRINLSPDLSIASYVQYDTDSDSVGINTRLRWTFRPVADLFVVYNHNVRSLLDRWQLDSNQLLVKLQYALRY